jgi:LruC domain-containing protein
MKKTVLFILALLPAMSGFTQVTNNFESGNRAVDVNNCWIFSNTNINASQPIQGKYTCQTGSLSSGIHTLTSPWILTTGSGKLTFKHKMDQNNGTSRLLRVFLLDASNQVVQTLYTYNYPGDKRTVVSASADISVAGVYRVKWEFTGTGGSSRGTLDEIVIDGTYNSDPTSNDGAGNCSAIVAIQDRDKDGVTDSDDQYPDDPYKAYEMSYPPAGWGSLAFEDLWPETGDYDFNDLVVDYKLITVTDAKNEIVEIKASFLTRAIGASFHNAFGLSLTQVPSGAIRKVVNSYPEGLSGKYFDINNNGGENGQTYATVIVFDDAFKVLPHPGTGSGVNTSPDAPYVEPKQIDVTIILKENGQSSGNPVPVSSWSDNNFNFFMIVKADQGRGREIHLADYPPTDLADRSLFGTGKDGSDLTANHTYRSIADLPWAINVTSSFAYPVEKGDVVKTHLKFGPWAETAGKSYPDWFQDKSNYRNQGLIYRH